MVEDRYVGGAGIASFTFNAFVVPKSRLNIETRSKELPYLKKNNIYCILFGLTQLPPTTGLRAVHAEQDNGEESHLQGGGINDDYINRDGQSQ